LLFPGSIYQVSPPMESPSFFYWSGDRVIVLPHSIYVYDAPSVGSLKWGTAPFSWPVACSHYELEFRLPLSQFSFLPGVYDASPSPSRCATDTACCHLAGQTILFSHPDKGAPTSKYYKFLHHYYAPPACRCFLYVRRP
jgi:hypothetical protein